MKIVVSSRRYATVAAVSAFVLTLGGCKDGAEPLVPAAIQVVAGDAQTAAAGGAVSIAPSVKVVSTSGKPVPNIRVTFTPGTASGVVIGGVQVTDARGVATVTSWTLGTKAGASTLTATADGVPAATITATTLAGAPTAMTAAAGLAQSATVGAAVAVAPAVKLEDAHGNGVPNVVVSFTAADGTLERASATTDASGVASAGKWTLGTRAGTQAITASAAGVPNVTIAATANADVATKLVLTREPSTTNASGERLSVQPQLEFRDRYENAANSSLPVTASIASGNGTLGGTTVANAQAGRVNFSDLTLTGSGAVQLRFTAPGFNDITSAAFTVAAVAQCAGSTMNLDFTLGQNVRFAANSPNAARCLNFSASANAGQQYLVMVENLSPRGSFSSGLFPGFQGDDGTFGVTVETRGASSSVASSSAIANSAAFPDAPAAAVHSWDFGGQRVYEIEPATPAGGAQPARVKRDGGWISANSMGAQIAVGDTILVTMEPIGRLGEGGQAQRRALVKFVSADIVIAEDLRIVNRDAAFTRSNGTGRNTPLTEAEMLEIATEYSAMAKVQADRLFGGAHNGATAANPGRPIAVHSMMYQDNIWGYTYSSTNYFVWDFWVGTQDGATKGIAQHAYQNADNLFMHEIAHMRHVGLLERAGRTHIRGNKWVVEGFARFTERLPIAMRLLGGDNPSRTGNVTLPFQPAYRNAQGQQLYHFDDVPTYRNVSSSLYDGYGASSYIFDYFADQVALAGGDWRAATAELLVNLGVEADASNVVARHLPGLDLGTLITRARVALYADDYTPGLPAWTQYHQYNLRASRPANGNNATADPRNLFPRIVPGQTFNDQRSVNAGGTYGYVIDGTNATANLRVDITPTSVPNGVVTIVRIK